MTTYLYKAKDQAGKTVSGTLEAETQSSAAEHVRRLGLVPVGLTELRRSSKVAKAPSAGPLDWLARKLIYPIWTGVSVKGQMVFFRQLATMLNAGMVLSSALGSVANQSGGKLRRIAKEAEASVAAGGRFSDVLIRYPWIFTRVQTGLIQAGEAGGYLDAMIDRIATYLEQEMDVRRLMRISTLYPKLLIVAAVTVPNLSVLILAGPVAYLQVEKAIILPFLIWGLVIYLAFKLLLQFDSFRAVYDTVKVSIPVIGSLVRKLSMARFSRALALLYSAGTPMAQAVQISAEAVGNFLVRRAVLKAVPAIAHGVPASEAMRQTGQVPQMVLDMLATGEKTGNVDSTVNKVAEYYEKEAEATIKALGIVIFVVLVLAVAIMIGMQVIRFWLGFAAKETTIPGM